MAEDYQSDWGDAGDRAGRGDALTGIYLVEAVTPLSEAGAGKGFTHPDRPRRSLEGSVATNSTNTKLRVNRTRNPPNSPLGDNADSLTCLEVFVETQLCVATLMELLEQ